VRALEKSLRREGRTLGVAGFTGAPGTGKSTLVDAVVALLRKQDSSVAVLATDPNSPFTGGAILGDRIRMQRHALDPKVFIRSMGARGHLGGLSLASREAIRLFGSFGFDEVILEDLAADYAKQLGGQVLIGLGTSGLVVAELLGIGLVGSPLVGRVVDRIGARTTLMASLALLAAGYGGFPFVRHPWQAFGLAAIAGAGNAGFAPSHSSLLAALTSREQRTVAYALTRVTDNLGFGIGGLIGGLIATTRVPASFDVLFAVDAGTFVAFMGLLLFVPAPSLSSARVSSSARAVARSTFRAWWRKR